MKEHGLKFLTAGLALGLMVLPGHGTERRPGAQLPAPQSPASNHVAAAPCECDVEAIDLGDADTEVSDAMDNVAEELADARVEAVLADTDRLDALVQEAAPRALEQEEQEGPVHSYFFSTEEDHGWLGVTIGEVTAEKVKELKLPAERGVVVTKVQSDSPAAKSGLKSGDVIIEIGGTRIEGTAQFRRIVREIPPGRAVTLTIWRDGSAQTLSTTLDHQRVSRHSGDHAWFSSDGEMSIPMPAMPEMPAMPPMAELFSPRTPRLGIDAEDLSGDLGKYFGAPDGEGVLVRDVRAGSPAEKAGLKAGDVIIKVAGARVRTTSDLRSNLRERRESKTADVVVIRKGTEMTLHVEVEAVRTPEGRRISRRIGV